MKFNKFDIVEVSSKLLDDAENKIGIFLHEDHRGGLYVLFLHREMDFPRTFNVEQMADPDSSSEWGEEEVAELHQFFGGNISYRYFEQQDLVTLVSRSLNHKGKQFMQPLNLIIHQLASEVYDTTIQNNSKSN